jgi:hypothetical protein
MDKQISSELKALQEGFTRAAAKYPGLLFDVLTIAIASPSQWEPCSVCQAFIEANRSQKRQEEWYIMENGRAVGRFHGNLAGADEFKRLGGSLHLAYCAVVQREIDYHGPSGFLDCLWTMHEKAFRDPTPRLRAEFRFWGIDGPLPDEAVLQDLLNLDAPSVGGRPPYPVHTYVRSLVHDVFTSAIAFIDAILGLKTAFPLASEEQFLVSDSRSWPGIPLFSIPQDGDEPIPEPEGEGTPTEQQDNKYPYLIRRKGRAWSVRFEDEDAPFSGKKRLLAIAKLFRQHGEQMDVLELDREGIDVEREEKAKQARSEQPGKVQSGGQDPKITEEGIQLMMKKIDSFEGDIRFAIGQPDLEKMDEVEELTVKLREICRFLDKVTCDKEYVERKSRAGEQGGAANQERAGDITDRIDELLEQIEHARNSDEGKTVVVLRKELLERLHCLLDTPREKMKHRRPRNNSDPEEDSRKAVDIIIERAKKDIAELMPRCGEYLKETVVRVSGKAKWIYTGDIVWKVEGI